MTGFIHEARSEAKPFLFVLALVAALGGFLFGYDPGEPMTCAPNAFQSGDGLVTLEPGESLSARWGIEPS